MKREKFIIVLLLIVCCFISYAVADDSTVLLTSANPYPTPEPQVNGSVWVASFPTGATINLDGIQKGLTDTFLTNIIPGTHNLTLKKTGYQTKTVGIEVKAGETKVLAPISLSPGEGPEGTTGSVYVASNPSNATIYLDGVMKGTTDKLVTNVSAGTHNLTLKKTGYQTKTVGIEVKAGETTVLAPICLTPGEEPADSGSVYVASVPSNATIYLDGVQKGLTDKLLTNVTAGVHNLTLNKTGYQNKTVAVEVKASETKILDPITLTPKEEPEGDKGAIFVSSFPSNATIYLDGVQKGLTDKFLSNISAGTHNLTLMKTGFQSKTVQVEVKAGEDTILDPITLTPKEGPESDKGSIFVSSFPSNATIYLDGVQKGLTDKLIANVSAGNHTLTLMKTGFQSKTVQVEVKAGEDTILDPITLTPKEGPEGDKGSIFVSSVPSNATIYLDGVGKGLTDKLISNITAGTHNLTLTKTGYQNKTVTVDVIAGETIVLAPICLTPGEGPGGAGSVYVASVPSNATIYLDGVQKGMTDKLVTNVSAGTHNLTLKKTGYQTKTVEIEMKAGETNVLAPISLTPGEEPKGKASIYVASVPSNATIYLDGVQRGQTNKLLTNVSAGTHNLMLKKTGYQSKTVEIEVQPGEDKVLAPIYLTPGEQAENTGSVYVASIPSNATIHLDGIQKGATNKLVTNITARTHNLTLTKVGYQATTIWVEIVAGVSKILASISLSPL